MVKQLNCLNFTVHFIHGSWDIYSKPKINSYKHKCWVSKKLKIWFSLHCFLPENMGNFSFIKEKESTSLKFPQRLSFILSILWISLIFLVAHSHNLLFGFSLNSLGASKITLTKEIRQFLMPRVEPQHPAAPQRLKWWYIPSLFSRGDRELMLKGRAFDWKQKLVSR